MLNRLNLSGGVIILACAAAALAALVSHASLTDGATEQDTAAYLFQAKLFSHGRLAAEAPPDRRLAPTFHLNIHDGRFYSKYPPGHSLFLVPGVWIGAPWLMPVLATGLTVWLLFLLARDMYGERVGVLAAGLGAISPAMIGLGATLYSEPTSRLMLAAYILGLLRWLQGGHWLYAVLAGAGVGYASITRPLTALVFAAAGAGLAAYSWWRPRAGIRAGGLAWKGLAPGVAVLLLFVGLQMGWNTAQTGDPLTSTMWYQQRGDRLGFGMRTFGPVEPESSSMLRIYTPEWAFERTWRHTLPSIAMHTLGWGVYRDHMFERMAIRPSVALSLIVAVALYCVMILPILHPGRKPYDWFLLSLFAGNVVAYGFFHFDGTARDFTPIGPRYHNEVMVLAMIPLLARGALLCWDALKTGRPILQWPATAVILVLLFVNTPYSHGWYARAYYYDLPEMQWLPEAVKEKGLRNAVVFTGQHNPITPIGEYPFVPIEEVNVVYCVIGTFDWNLMPEESWRSIHQRLFPDREPWLWDQPPKQMPRLIRLDPAE